MFRLSGCYPSPWQDIGEYKTIHSALCAMASRTGDYQNMIIYDLEQKSRMCDGMPLRVAHYTEDGVK